MVHRPGTDRPAVGREGDPGVSGACQEPSRSCDQSKVAYLQHEGPKHTLQSSFDWNFLQNLCHRRQNEHASTVSRSSSTTEPNLQQTARAPIGRVDARASVVERNSSFGGKPFLFSQRSNSNMVINENMKVRQFIAFQHRPKVFIPTWATDSHDSLTDSRKVAKQHPRYIGLPLVAIASHLKASLLLVAMPLVTSSDALATSSDALATSSFLLPA